MKTSGTAAAVTAAAASRPVPRSTALALSATAKTDVVGLSKTTRISACMVLKMESSVGRAGRGSPLPTSTCGTGAPTVRVYPTLIPTA